MMQILHKVVTNLLILMEAFGLTNHICEVAIRLALEGYGVVAPNLYYREGQHLTFGYDEVDQAMATMYRLDFGQPIEHDLQAAIAFLKTSPIETRFHQLGKPYTLKLYPEASHGFFCHERQSYHAAAAIDAWQELTRFLQIHL